MKLDAIIISTMYNHFYKMKERGRNVIPWFQTASVLSLLVTMLLTLLIKIGMDFLNKGYYQLNIKEPLFLIGFISTLILSFLLIKKFYFDNEKHIIFYKEFNQLSNQKKTTYSVVVILTTILLPFLLFLILGLDAMKYQS
jgi:pilus assembly protein TadC